MRRAKYLICLLVAPLLIGCGNGGSGGGGKTTSGPTEPDFDHSAEPLDVDNISVGDVKKDTLGGEVKVEGGKAYFDFYEVSDFHGAVNFSTSDKTIGLSKMADYFAKARANNPGGTIVVSSGDMFQGSAESNLTRGYLVNYGMNVMGFEAMTLGNHEFDWSVEWIKKNANLKVNNYSIPFLGANVFDKSTGKLLDGIQASTVITRGEYKIGVVGTLGDGAEKSIMTSLIEGLEFKQEYPIVSAEAQRLKNEEHCDIVIWTSHRDAEELMSSTGVQKSDGIDAVFGGHSHANNALISGDGIPFLQTKNYGKGIAHAQLALDLTTRDVTCSTYEVDDKPYQKDGLEDHAEINRIMSIYNEKLDPIKNEVIGTTDEELDISMDFALTNLCVETMAMAANKWGEKNNNIKVVASFHNANGGVRSTIEEGDIKFGDVYRSFPFDNEVVLVEMTGATLKGILLKADQHGFYRDVEVLSSKEAIKDDQKYYITTTDFMATSPNFDFRLEEDDLVRTGYVVRDVVASRIKFIKNIKKENFTRYDNEKFRLPE